jgi:hypothetical protein
MPTFDCPRCTFRAEYRTRATAGLGVFVHVYTRHPRVAIADGAEVLLDVDDADDVGQSEGGGGNSSDAGGDGDHSR